MAKKQYEHLGGGRFDVFREKPKKNLSDKLGEFFGCVFIVGIGIVILNAVFG